VGHAEELLRNRIDPLSEIATSRQRRAAVQGCSHLAVK